MRSSHTNGLSLETFSPYLWNISLDKNLDLWNLKESYKIVEKDQPKFWGSSNSPCLGKTS